MRNTSNNGQGRQAPSFFNNNNQNRPQQNQSRSSGFSRAPQGSSTAFNQTNRGSSTGFQQRSNQGTSSFNRPQRPNNQPYPGSNRGSMQQQISRPTPQPRQAPQNRYSPQFVVAQRQSPPIASDYDSIIPGKTTIFPIRIEPGATVFRYDVTIVKNPDNRQKAKELTKQNDPGMKSAQRIVCTDIIEALYTMTQSFGSGCKYVYDGKKILFTTVPIQINQTTRLMPNHLSSRAALFVRGEQVDVTITQNERIFQLDYSNLSSALVRNAEGQTDRSIRTFLEILTSQPLIATGKYQYITAGSLFQNATIPLVAGMQMRVGFSKGVKIAGNPNNPGALLVMDMKRTAFYAKKNVSDIFQEFVNGPGDRQGLKQFEKFMRGVRVIITYDPSRNIIFKCLTEKPVNQYFVNGRSIPQYMAQNRNIHLQHPEMLGAHPDQPNSRNCIYPLECLEVLGGQLVPIEKYHTQASQRLIAENSIPAAERYDYIIQQTRGIATGEAGHFLNHFGVKIDLNNDVEIKQRHLPNIHAGENKVIAVNEKANWFADNQHAKFIDPSHGVDCWIVAYDSEDRSIAEANLKKYVAQLLQEAHTSGMHFPQPAEYSKAPLQQLDNLFQYAAKHRVQFILYIDGINKKSHDKLKLFEAYYKILTQHIVTRNLQPRVETLKNVTMKLNAKNFGTCYVPDVEPQISEFSLDQEDLLIIGIDLAHPQQMSPKDKFMLKKKGCDLDNKHPTIVGVSANKMANHWGFAGDFFYQPHENDIADQERLRNAVRQLVETAKQSRRVPPRRVLIYRDGLSEGQQQDAIKLEIPAIKQGIRDIYPSLDPKVCYIVGTKDHHKRIYRFTNNRFIQNTAPGDIVDSTIVRQDVTEFYQQPHFPLKGSPKMLQITVLVNELEIPVSAIQRLNLVLSYNHQISACGTSLPVPITVAHETAKRGFNIYNELYRMKTLERSQFAREIKLQNDVFNFDQLSQTLGYANSELVATRYNA